jgi:hypothetical protein
MAGYNKGTSTRIFKQLLHLLPTAKSNAVWALQCASDEDAMNPSTKLHLVLDHFEQLGVLTATP